MTHARLPFTPPSPPQSSRILPEATDPRHVSSDHPLVLDDDSVWIVRAGQIDVFAVPVAADGTHGRREHLFRAGCGDPLFGLGALVSGRALIAVGAGGGGARVDRVRQSLLRALVRDPARGGEARSVLERWIELVCAGLARDVMPKQCGDLVPGTPVAFERPGAARPRGGVSWVRHTRGHSYLVGLDVLTINGSGYTPIAHDAWLQFREPSTIAAVRTDDVEDPGELWAGLSRLHALALQCAAVRAEQADAAAGERLKRRAVARSITLNTACASLAASIEARSGATDEATLANARALSDSSDMPLLDDGPNAALFAAVRAVARAMGIAVRPPRTYENANPLTARDPLAALLRDARIRCRKVALREQWWRHDHGPLLAYLAGSVQQPVALLRDARGYTRWDPASGETTRVDAPTADALAPFAFSFYRPFPDVAVSVRQLLAFSVFGSRRDLLVALAMGLCAAVLGMVPSVATGMLFNHVIPGAQRPQLYQLMFVLVVCAVTTTMFTLARRIAMLRAEGKMGAVVQAAVWDRLLSLPLPFFRPYTAGDLAMRAMSIDAMRQVISGSTVTAIMGGLFSIGNFVLMFYYSAAMAWRATLLLFIGIGLTGLGSWLQLRPQRGVLTLQAKTAGLVLQFLSSVAKLRVAAAEAPAFALWARHFGAQRRLEYRVRRIANWIAAFNAAFPVAALILLFWTALAMIGRPDGLRTGDFLAFLAAFGECSSAMLATSGAILAALSTVPLYEQAKPILRALPEVDVGKTDPGTLSGDIEIRRAHFRYQADGPLALRDVSLHVGAGEFVALVGPSGSGKSTLLRLLLGFETLESGTIAYDGQDIAGLDVQALRRQMGVVLQNGRIMSGDIYTNIVGSAPLSMEEAWEAARMAGFADDIRAMPMGMYTVLSEGASTLSGGQRQRLMIARAIVSRPRILLFDEATSALDNRTQATVSQSLERLAATRIVIAHRLSTIVNADRIHVLDHGRLVQSGSYEELLHADGLFAELARRQIV